MENNTVRKHCNGLIFDTQNKTIERFDPLGNRQTELWRESDLDQSIIKRFNQYQLISLYLEEEGMQTIQGKEPVLRIHYLTDPKGFCSAWVIWYLEARFIDQSNSDLNPSQILSLHTQILSSIKYEKGEKKITLRGFIRNYSNYATIEAKKLMP